MRLSIVVLCAMLASQLANAAEEEDIFLADMPVVLSVSRLPQRQQDLPTSVTVLDRELIKASGARDISDLMRLVPGFQTFAHTTDPTRVTYHGITDEDFSPRVQVLVDGRSLYSPLFRSGVNWSLVPVAIEDIERIEVVRGTNSASYGTNAFLGVINIITVDPSLTHGTHISTNQGNQGVRDYTLRTATEIGEAGNLRLTYQQKDDQALNDRADWADSYRSRLLDVRTDFQLSDVDALELRFGRIEATQPMGLTSGPDQSGYPLHPFTQSSNYFQANLNHVLNDHADLSFHYAYTSERAYDSFEGFSSGFNVFYNDGSFTGESQRQEFEVQHTFSPAKGLRMVWGTGYRTDAVRSPVLFHGNPRYTRHVTREFGNMEWKPANWLTTNLGASFDQDSLSGNSISPRASFNVHFSPEHSVRLALAKAVRSGAINDYKGNKWYEATRDATGTPIPPATIYKFGYYGDANMPSERLRSVALSYLGDWRQLNMTLEVRAFRDIIPNRLLQSERDVSQFGLCDALCPNSTADFTTPAQRIRITGIEYQWQWQPSNRTRFLLNQSYTKIRASYLESYLNNPSITSYYLDPDGLDRDRRLAEESAPRVGTSLMLMQKLGTNLHFSLAGYQQGAMKWTRNSTSTGFTRFDARLAYPFRWGPNQAEVALTSQAINGSYGEFKADGTNKDRIVDRRTWVSFTLSL